MRGLFKNKPVSINAFALVIGVFFLCILFPTVVQAACCNTNADCSGGSCACDSCGSGCDCGHTECCNYDGVCDTSSPCEHEGVTFAGTCRSGSCYCSTDCGSGGGSHKECNDSCQCVEVSGDGSDECGANSDCYPCGTCIPCDCGTNEAASSAEEFFAMENSMFQDDKVLGAVSVGSNQVSHHLMGRLIVWLRALIYRLDPLRLI